MSDLTGPNQAQTMLHRVSPEGRARAQREQDRRRQRTTRIAGRVFIVALAVAVALVVYDLVFGSLPVGAVLGGVAVVVLAAVALGMRSRERALPAAALEQAPLSALPQTTALWLEAQVPALPAPAAKLADTIASELGALGPQIARLAPGAPAGDAARRLLAVELPALVEHYRSVPPALREKPREGGHSADAHLVNGLGIVREEVARMSEQLAGGDFDALATQERFLELKYQGEAMLALPRPDSGGAA